MKIQQAARCGIILGLSGFLSLNLSAQQLKLGNNPTAIKKDAVLELNSPDQGLLLPRVPRSAILTGGKLFNADDGMLVFVNDASEKSLYIKRNGAWEKVSNISTTTLTGPITGSGEGSIATSITNQAVTYEKIQNVSNQSILGRYATSNGSVQELKLGSGLLLNNTNGTITADAGTNLWNANRLQGLNISTTAPTNGQVLRWNSTSSVWEPGAAGGSSTITLTGNVTGTSSTGSIATTIANKAVTYARIQDVAAQKLLGRYSNSTGVTQEITISTGLALNNSNGNLTADNTNNIWNANRIQSRDVATTTPNAGEVLKWNNTTSRWEPAADLNGGATYGVLPDNDIRKADAPGVSDRMKIWASPVTGTPVNGVLGTSAYSWNVLSFQGGGYTTQLFFDKNLMAIKEWSGNTAPLTSNAGNPWYKTVMTHGDVIFTDGGLIFAGKTDDATTEVRQQADKLFWNRTNERLGVGTNTPNSTLHAEGSVSGKLTVVTGNYTPTDNDFTIVGRRNTGDMTITLPDPNTCPGRIYHFVRDYTSWGNMIVRGGTSAQFAPGPFTFGSNNCTLCVQSIGSRWVVLSINW